MLKYFDTNKFIAYLLLVIFGTSFAYLSSESNHIVFCYSAQFIANVTLSFLRAVQFSFG